MVAPNTLRLERSGREAHGLSSMPLEMRLKPSFMRSAPKLRMSPSRLWASSTMKLNRSAGRFLALHEPGGSGTLVANTAMQGHVPLLH